MKTNITLFKNSKQNENQPDFRASFKDAEGNWHNVASVWVKNGAKGQYLSLSVDTDELAGYQASQEEYRSKKTPATPKITSDPFVATEPSDVEDLPF